ncbi:MAG: hypothetical protein AB2A00_16920 [Myxococcota bacterium]
MSVAWVVARLVLASVAESADPLKDACFEVGLEDRGVVADQAEVAGCENPKLSVEQQRAVQWFMQQTGGARCTPRVIRLVEQLRSQDQKTTSWWKVGRGASADGQPALAEWKHGSFTSRAATAEDLQRGTWRDDAIWWVRQSCALSSSEGFRLTGPFTVQREAVKQCLETVSPGRIRIRWVILPNGRAAGISAPEGKDSPAAPCLGKLVQRWDFGPDPEGERREVVFPFTVSRR